jgi:hypothetical protein
MARELRPGIWRWQSRHPEWERDARGLGLPVHTPLADTWEDWVEKFGVDPDRVRGLESDDLAWLRAGDHGPGSSPFVLPAHGEPTDRAALERALS